MDVVSKKPYYVVLDGLRGTAAIVILIFHYMEAIYTDYEKSPLGHGFLAVDFFYCLSGFVIGFAYDKRIKTEGTKRFFINRLIRLHPLVLLGSVLGAIGYISDPYVPGVQEAGWSVILLSLAGSVLLIPTPVLPYRGGALFPYNSPSWSLFFEYIANILYALVLVRISKKMLLLLAFLGAVWITYTAYTSHWLINGWDAKTWFDGLPRVFFSFTAGLCVYRFRFIWKNKLGAVLPLALLLLIFLVPHHNNDWIVESLIVVLVFPLIICIGAGSVAGEKMNRFCTFIGKLSYPLYMTHISAVWMFTNYYNQYHPSGMKLVSIVTVLSLLNLVIAYLVMRFFDEPVRKWLTARRKKYAKLELVA